MKKRIYISLGVLCVCLGALGVALPLLPTTPFLLLATFLFSRSSEKLNKMLLENKVFGKYLYNYFNNIPIPLKDKLVSIAFLWAGLGASFYFANFSKKVLVILLIVGVSVTIHIATIGRKKF